MGEREERCTCILYIKKEEKEDRSGGVRGREKGYKSCLQSALVSTSQRLDRESTHLLASPRVVLLVLLVMYTCILDIKGKNRMEMGRE